MRTSGDSLLGCSEIQPSCRAPPLESSRFATRRDLAAMRQATIAIIGAGFSGSVVAIHLAQARAAEPLTIYLIDRRGTFGPRLAYSPPSDTFKLNVRAKAMGAFPDDPEAFLRWVKERQPGVGPDDFVSRTKYGEYLTHLVEQASLSPENNRIIRVHDEVTGVSVDRNSGAFTLKLKVGSPLTVDRCVVAIGNVMKRALTPQEPANFYRDPFEPTSYSDLSHARSLVIIGAGLTAVDVIMEAERQGFRGHYAVVSRHGHLPLAHEANAPHMETPLPAGWELLGSVSKLLKLVRKQSRPLASSQPVIDAMRPHLQAMWRNLPPAERRRFLRHVRPLWEMHRHRIPAEHALEIQRLRDEGRLDVIAGRVTSTSYERGHCTVQVSKRGPTTPPLFLKSEATFLCAGTEGDLSRINAPLIQNLLDQGLLSPGPLKLGAGETGGKNNAFWILGPLQREARWEITAVRELREEALSISRQIIASLDNT